MKLITGFLKFIGINAFMAFIVLLLLDYENMAVIFLVVSISSLAVLLFFQVYKFYLVNNLKKNKPKE